MGGPQNFPRTAPLHEPPVALLDAPPEAEGEAFCSRRASETFADDPMDRRVVA